jgi:hypothetical protein
MRALVARPVGRREIQKLNGTNMVSKTYAGTISALSALKPIAGLAMAAAMLTACGGGDYTAKEDSAPRSGPTREYDPKYDKSVLGAGGFSIGNVRSGAGGIFGGGGDEKARLPVNKYLWQGALDTLSFLPLTSTDPFTGVIATDWGSTAEAPGERFKVTAYILNPDLSAASLKVAVFREQRNESGLWLPVPVSADTARQLEDAILTRARQIRIAEVEGGVTG